jgi:hypothetical protein
MGQPITLDLPQEVYEPLVDSAQRAGATPEALAIEWLTAVSRFAARDPIESFIGTLRSHLPDWTERHDHYFGQTLTERADPVSGE